MKKVLYCNTNHKIRKMRLKRIKLLTQYLITILV